MPENLENVQNWAKKRPKINIKIKNLKIELYTSLDSHKIDLENHIDLVIPSDTENQFPEESILLHHDIENVHFLNINSSGPPDLQDLIDPIADEPIASSIEYTQTAQMLADLNSDSDDAANFVSEDSDVSSSSRLVVVESESQIVTSQSDASGIDEDNKQVNEPSTPPSYLKGFVKAKSPLHLDKPTLKRPLSTDDESLDHKK